MGGHSHADGEVEVATPVRRAVQIAVAAVSLLTLAGLVVLWPGGDVQKTPTGAYTAGEVIESGPCKPPADDCAHIRIEVVEGPDAGTTIGTDFMVSGSTATLDPGTGVWLTQPIPGEYGYADVRRDGGLIWLGVIFAVAVIAFARWKGVAALAGLVSSLGILAWFVLPALLLGSDPVAVAAVGAAAIAIASMGFAHGVSVRTGVALIGTILALLLTLALGSMFTGLTHLTGLGSEDAFFLQMQGSTIDLKGLFLAGLVIGALGVLDDVTVTQAAAVSEVKSANPAAGWKDLFTSGMRVGRDHVAATVNTLVLAYVGAALPLFLLITLADAPTMHALNSEILAQEVVRALVGSMGIIAAVPITTGLMALILTETPNPKPIANPEEPSQPDRRRTSDQDFWSR